MGRAIFKGSVLPVLLIVLGAMTRFLPHPANFVPVGAIAVFGGIYLPKRFALLVPLAAMLVSDLIIGFYDIRIMLPVYGGFLFMGAMGLWVRKNRNAGRILGGTFLGSLFFFIVTNAAVWAFGTMYAHNFTGLMESYFMALPFFRNSLLADIFYTGVLVGGAELALRLASRKKLQWT